MSLVHLVREPTGDPDGALVLLHGRGTSEHDLVGLLDELDPARRLVGLTPGAPLTNIPPGGRHWYVVPRVGYPDPATFHASYEQLGSFLDSFLGERGIGWDRTVVGGFSMGCVMSYALSLGPGRPRPAGVIALSGFVPTVEGWQPDFAGREGMPVYVHHGRNDPIISVDFARRAVPLLESHGVDVEYDETEAAHFLPLEAVEGGLRLVDRALG